LLVVGESVGDEVAEFFVERVAGFVTVAEDYERAWNLACIGVGLGDYAAVAHGGMFEKNGFDLGRCDREALVLDHFFSTVEDVVEVIGVSADNVSGIVPTVA